MISLVNVLLSKLYIYWCRCGKFHHGNYSIEDYLHHACLYNVDLMALVLIKGGYIVSSADTNIQEAQVICGDCGETWMVDLATAD